MSYKIEKTAIKQLKGIAIIFVVFGHLAMLNYLKVKSLQLKLTGVWGVSIFLLLSGYGLMQSYISKGIDFNFLGRRLRRVLLPYIIITFIWVTVDGIFFKKYYSVLITIKSFLALDFKYSVDPTMWYITYIFLWYIVFFIIFILPIKNITKVVSIIFCAIILKKSMFVILFDWNYYYMAFPIGVLISYVISKDFCIARHINNKFILMIPCILFFGIFLYNILRVGSHTQYNKLGFGSIFLAFSISLLFALVEYNSKILSFLGSISYEIYLLEGKIVFIYGLPKVSSNVNIQVLVYCLIIILGAVILSKLVKIIDRRLFQH